MLNGIYFVLFTHIISSDEVENCHESYMWKDAAKARVVHSENDNPAPKINEVMVYTHLTKTTTQQAE